MKKSTTAASTVYQCEGFFYRLQPVLYGSMALLFLGAAAAVPKGNLVESLLCGAFGLYNVFVAWRCRRFGQLEVSIHGVTVYNVVRRQSWGWDEVDYFSIKIMGVAYSTQSTRVLVVHDRNGKQKVVRSFGTRVRRNGVKPWIGAVVDELNERLRYERAAARPGRS